MQLNKYLVFKGKRQSKWNDYLFFLFVHTKYVVKFKKQKKNWQKNYDSTQTDDNKAISTTTKKIKFIKWIDMAMIFPMKPTIFRFYKLKKKIKLIFLKYFLCIHNTNIENWFLLSEMDEGFFLRYVQFGKIKRNFVFLSKITRNKINTDNVKNDYYTFEKRK